MTRDQQLDYARERHVTLPVDSAASATAPRRREAVSASGAGEPASVDIAFERGAPVGVNGVAMPLLDLIGSLGIIAGAHGVDAVWRRCTRARRAGKGGDRQRRGKFSSPRIAAAVPAAACAAAAGSRRRARRSTRTPTPVQQPGLRRGPAETVRAATAPSPTSQVAPAQDHRARQG